MKSRKLLTAFGLAATAAATAPSNATILSVPEEYKSIAQPLTYADPYPEYSFLDWTGLGQTFTPTETTTDPFKVSILTYLPHNNIFPGTTVNFKIVKDYFGTNELLETQQVVITNPPEQNPPYVDPIFTPLEATFSVPLEAGQTYAFIVDTPRSPEGMNLTEGIHVFRTANNTEDREPSGFFFYTSDWYRQDPAYSAAFLADMIIDIRPAVPEPATYALMAGGLVAVAGAAFAKRRREENAVAANTNETQHGAAVRNNTLEPTA